MEANIKVCKYCKLALEFSASEGLDCILCKQSVHSNCLIRGSVPGGLTGDVFFTYTCKECSPTNEEVFLREKLSWLKVIVLVLYHMQTKNPGLARRGYFHWRNHLTAFIEKHWDVLFNKDTKRKKKIQGTIAGQLSNFSKFFFQKGEAIFNEPAWWTLTYPKLSPAAVSLLYSRFADEKQRLKQEKVLVNDMELFQKVLTENVQDKHLLTRFTLLDPGASSACDASASRDNENQPIASPEIPTSESPPTTETLDRRNSSDDHSLDAPPNSGLAAGLIPTLSPKIKYSSSSSDGDIETKKTEHQRTKPRKKKKVFLDPLCYYNTSLQSLSKSEFMPLEEKLLGSTRVDFIISPFTKRQLKPYIWRDAETTPPWLKLMAHIKVVANKNVKDYALPPRSSVDYVRIQPSHIPAINSLCNQFFWPGINVSESLQFPDFSCVVVYRKLIVGFAFLIPNISVSENYLSFLFVRPGWRNCGIGKFMLYFLQQSSPDKDMVLHVSVNSPALFLYQKLGFKVERLEKDFYDKYIANASESKNAFFCRLERD